MPTKEAVPIPEAPISETELRAKRTITIALVIFAVVMVGLIALLVILSIGAYDAARSGEPPAPGAVVVSLLRDAAIIMVAFETLLIGALMVVLTIQIQALVTLLRDEIRPMLEAVNDTVSTVRGTTQFVSHNVVSPTIEAASFLAGVQRVVREVIGLGRGSQGE
ncbi:MAG: hypothetical protein JXD18_03500 [Anaerolineae bacterium]|nr:hypothetical protein [Anaerolineae bacterium]